MSFQVVVTCLSVACVVHPKRSMLLAPVESGLHEKRESASEDAKRRKRETGLGMSGHRFDVVRLKPNGWPLCPCCNDDELYSLAMPAGSSSELDGCYACGTSHGPMLRALQRKDAEEIEEVARAAAGMSPDDTGPIVLPGWSCPVCRCFNGSAKEVLPTCRACGAAKPGGRS